MVLGRVYLCDRVGTSIEAFTFGGRLQLEQERELTHCRLTSTAPIRDLEATGTWNELLASEVEIAVAACHGNDLDRVEEMDRKLGEADPAQLYASCLITLRDRFQSFDPLELPE